MKTEKIFELFYQNNNTPKTELEYKNPFTLLCAVVLSAQSTDVGVNKATKLLFSNYDTPSKMLNLGEEGLKGYIKTIGLYNNKAKNIIAVSRILLDKYDGNVPNSMEALLSLPGIGRKSASVILNCIYGKVTMPVDTHVFRVSKRIGLATSNTPAKVEQELLKNIPEKWLLNAHHWLVLHGRYICKAKKPKCDVCFISSYCNYYKNLNS